MNSEIDGRIRDAVAAGEIGKASALWEIYAALVMDEIRGGTCSEARLAQVRELIDWTRGVILCARTHSQHRINTRLAELHAAAVYGRLFR